MLFQLPKAPTELRVIHLNERLEQQRRRMAQQMASRLEQLQLMAQLKKEQIHRKRHPSKLFVLDFKGDIQANAVEQLREEVTLLLSTAKAGKDKIMIRLESPGGAVHGYGLAAAQLARLREAGFELTICVDKVAASGGYMMACVANHIVAAPFAVVGSIGVVAQLPNFYKLLKKHDIDYEMFTAGEYKRTVTIFGENTDADRAKFEQEIQHTHDLFKHFVTTYRPQLDVAQVATGEHWYGEDALNLKLVDELSTSDAWLLQQLPKHEIYLIETRRRLTLGERLGFHAAQFSASLVPTLVTTALDTLQKQAQRPVQLRDERL